jgi:hypothetical protein
MEVVIQIAPPARTDSVRAEHPLAAVQQAVSKLALKVEPQHPGITDPVLSTYYKVEAPDAQSAAKVVETVRNLPSVAAAYVKPQDAPP